MAAQVMAAVLGMVVACMDQGPMAQAAMVDTGPAAAMAHQPMADHMEVPHTAVAAQCTAVVAQCMAAAAQCMAVAAQCMVVAATGGMVAAVMAA